MFVLADAQALQNSITAKRGIGRYVAEFATAVEQNRPGAISGWILRADQPMPVHPPSIVSHGLFRMDDDPDLPTPDVWHVLSPFESIMSPIEHVWPRWSRAARTRLVVTLYDLIPLLYPDRYLADSRLRRAYLTRLQLIERADRVLAISQASADDAIRLLNIPARRIQVVGTGVSEHFVPPSSVDIVFDEVRMAVSGIRPGYVMYTGGIDFRKNIDGLMLAYSKLPAQLRTNHQLVIVCSVLPSERLHLEEVATGLDIQQDFLLTGFVTDQTLLRLYQAAHLFVFPSLYEGFGLPVVEALSCGAPALVGSNSSLTELVPDPRAQFDATSADSISRTMFSALTIQGYREQLQNSVLRRDYRWNVVAERILDAYESLTQRPAKSLRMPRIAFITPMPPAASGVADYSARLLPEFAGRVAVDVFTGLGADRPSIDGVAWFSYADFETTNAVRGPYDVLLYAMGNSAHHVEVLRILRRWGGVALSHDTRYTGLMGVLEKDFVELLDHQSAATLASIAEGVLPADHRNHNALDPGSYYSTNGLLTGQALVGASAVLVHSKVAAMLARANMASEQRDRVEVVPFGHRLLTVPPETAKDAVVSLGVVDRIKQSDLVCRAFVLLARRHPELIFAIVGEIFDENLDAELQAIVAEAGLGDRVVITGRVDVNTYQDWILRARLAVQLRAHSNGENSGTVADCLGASVPLVVTDTGTMAAFGDLCELVEPTVTLDSLVDVIERLLVEDERTSRRAVSGRLYAEQNSYTQAAVAILRACGIVTPEPPGSRCSVDLSTDGPGAVSATVGFDDDLR